MIDTDFFKRNANFFAFKAICVAQLSELSYMREFLFLGRKKVTDINA